VSITYRVTHRTEYRYASDVVPSYSQLHLVPRELPGQGLRSATVTIDPEPEYFTERIDYFGNRVAYAAIQEPHRRLTVTADSVVVIGDRPDTPSLLGERPWEQVRDEAQTSLNGDRLEAAQFALDSPRVRGSSEFADYARQSFAPERPLLDAVSELCSRIHADFEYKPGSTTVNTPVAEVFAQRKGVCQDFAHLGIACLRALGLPARYVSGYLETDPPPGRPKLTGADVSHAWLSVLLGEADWVDVDPTNDQLVNDRYIVTAYGRDYSDVPPLKGVIHTRGKTRSLKVTVDVVAIEGP
jgi:transglutaminase-like putative cysteine protease